MFLTYKKIVFLFFSSTLGLSVASFYFEFVVGLTPCPLCIMQRLMVLLLTVFLLVALCLRTFAYQFINAVILLLLSDLGIYFSARQVWLQHLPKDSVPACGPGLNALINYFPLKDILSALFFGSGDCAKVDWRWLGFSMGQWCLVAFICLNVAALVHIVYLIKIRQLK